MYKTDPFLLTHYAVSSQFIDVQGGTVKNNIEEEKVENRNNIGRIIR